jgi:hypothetical protein
MAANLRIGRQDRLRQKVTRHFEAAPLVWVEEVLVDVSDAVVAGRVPELDLAGDLDGELQSGFGDADVIALLRFEAYHY